MPMPCATPQPLHANALYCPCTPVCQCPRAAPHLACHTGQLLQLVERKAVRQVIGDTQHLWRLARLT